METKSTSELKARGSPKYILMAILFAFLPLIPILVSPSLATTSVVKAVGTFIFIVIVAMSIRSYVSIFYGKQNTINKKSTTEKYPTVSIVVPSYNEEKVLTRTIKSMYQLDYPREKIEFIYVYESECTDRTEEVITKYAREDERIKPVKRMGKKAGKAAAANYGIRQATGDIVVSLDADHSLKPDALKRAASWFQDKDVVCVKGRCRAMNKESSFIAKLSGVERDVVERLSIYSSYKVQGFSFFGGGQGFFRRKIFDLLGSFDEGTMTEDVDYSVKLHLAGHNIIVDPRIESWEENPPDLMGWWQQRKRWSRGWMQVARNHMLSIMRNNKISLFKKLDMVMGLSSSLLSFITPIMLPLMFISLIYFRASFFTSDLSAALWIFATMTPFTIGITTWYLDIREGERPRWSEIPYFFLLLPYFIFHGIVAWTGFVDEFIFKKKSEYIKTDRDPSFDSTLVV